MPVRCSYRPCYFLTVISLASHLTRGGIVGFVILREVDNASEILVSFLLDCFFGSVLTGMLVSQVCHIVGFWCT
jgi:hypothetical protein